jgi:hypothetical protein
MATKQESFKIPLVRVSYTIVNFLQYITTTYLIKKFVDKGKTKNLFKSIVSGVVLFWLVFALLVLVFKSTFFIRILFIFRLWEVLIINTWMFLFRQAASKVSNTESSENDIRLFILLVFQYITIILFYASFYFSLYTSDISNFSVGSQIAGSVFTWLYFSVITIATVGYGDITPVSILAKLVTISEILFGMFFILLFITTILSKIKFNWKES